MSHRDNLLTAARTCLLTTGYGATTVRDLVAESGANQASISYHFGSKAQLMATALFDLNREWGLVLLTALGVEQGPDGRLRLSSTERMGEAQLWQRVIDSIRENTPLWYVNFEAIAHAQHDAAIRTMLAEGQAWLRDVLALAFAGLEPERDAARRHAVGSHYYACVIGVAVQWLSDPEHAPSAAALARTSTASEPGAR